MKSQRLHDLKKFYNLLDEARERAGGLRYLNASDGRMEWPQRGVYFFMEDNESRSDSGHGPRIVRVGTHATEPSKVTLWQRLSQHRGNASGTNGSQRASVFRKIVGTALINRDGYQCPSWDQKNRPKDEEGRKSERHLEEHVSGIIGTMPFIWIAVDDEPVPGNRRDFIERNAVGLLSNYNKPELDAPSTAWLGRHCNREAVRKSGLWNSDYVNQLYDPAFLERLKEAIRQ